MLSWLQRLFPARHGTQQAASQVPGERLLHARHAAAQGIRKMPECPGIWVRTTVDGNQRIHRVKDCNGELYATVGFLVPIAVPTTKMPGYWDRVD